MEFKGVPKYGSIQAGSQPIIKARAHTEPAATHNENQQLDLPQGLLFRSKSVPEQITHKLSNMNRALSQTFYTPPVATNESVFVIKRARSQLLQEAVTFDSATQLPDTSRNLNVFKAGTNILNLFVGLGLLSQPYAIRQGGIISLVWLLIITMIASYTGKILVRCFKNMSPEMKSYPDIGWSAFNKFGYGAFGRYFARIAILCDVGLALSIFIVISWQNLIYLSDINAEYNYIIIIAVSVAIIPTVLLLKWSDLVFISLIGIIAAVFLCFIIVVNLFVNWDVVKSNYHNNEFAVFPKDFESFALSFGIYLFTYGGHAFFAPIYDEMKAESQKSFEPMVDVTFFIMFILHAVIGIAGYLPYCGTTQVLITQNLLSNKKLGESVLSMLATALIFLSSFCTVSPINSAVCGTLEDMLGIYKGYKKRLFRIFIIIVWCVFSWVLMNKLVILEAMAGAVAIMTVTYIAPFMFYAIIYQNKLSTINYYLLLSFAAICVVLAIFFTYLNVSAALNPINNNS